MIDIFQDPQWRETVIQYAGVAVSLAGAFVVAPGGTVKLWMSLRQVLSRSVPWLLRPWSPRRIANGSDAAFGIGTVVGRGYAWSSGDTIEEKIGRLRRHLEGVREHIATLEEEVRSGLENARKDRLRIEQNLQAVEQEVEHLSREATENDARALPVIGFGILMSGLAEPFSRISWIVSLPIFMVVIGIVLTISVCAVRAYRAAR